MDNFDFIEKPMTTGRVFRYAGGKTPAAKYLFQCIPQGVTEVVSPFLGGGTFELYLGSRGISVYGSDLLKPLVNLWTHILADSQRLAERAQAILLKTDRVEMIAIQKGGYFEIEGSFEQAAYFYLLCSLSWGGMPFYGTIKNFVVRDGHAYEPNNPQNRCTQFDRLRSFFSPLLHVEHADYQSQLAKYPKMFAYLDPPYPDVGGDMYGWGTAYHTDFDHTALRDLLRKRSALWILSYNDKPIIRELYGSPEFIIKPQWWKQPTNTHTSTREVVIFPRDYPGIN